MAQEGLSQRYYQYAEQAGLIIRQLGFAGLAVVWIFKTDIGGKPVFPERLILAALLIVIALALDLLHYFCGSIQWAHRASHPRSPEDTQRILEGVSSLTFGFLAAKIGAIMLAYGLILWYLATHLYGSTRL